MDLNEAISTYNAENLKKGTMLTEESKKVLSVWSQKELIY